MIQPPLAFIWSFLILGERLNGWRTLGIAIVLSGLLTFLLANQHAKRAIAYNEASSSPRTG